ncbi:MAG: hypothetical protein ABI963_04430 [Rhizomicrobium sp.]
MESIWIDTALLSIPNYAVDEEVAQSLFDRVTFFETLLSGDSPVRLVVSDYAETDLWQNQCGPGFQEIKDFVDLMNLGAVFSANDLLKSYNAILTRAHRASDVAGIEVRGFSAFESSPPIPRGMAPVAMLKFTKLAFASVAALRFIEDSWHLGSALPLSVSERFEIVTTIEEITGAACDKIGVPPVKIINSVIALARYSDIISAEEALRIWRNATASSDLYLAISMMALEARRGMYPDATLNDLLQFKIGPAFFESLVANQCAKGGRFSEQVLSRCSHVIADTGRVVIGEYGKPQVVRKFDGASGHRFHVSSGGVGLRAMFWQSGDVIEFANVGPKFELVIEFGNHGCAIGASNRCLC